MNIYGKTNINKPYQTMPVDLGMLPKIGQQRAIAATNSWSFQQHDGFTTIKP
jgi:hypothetical protein